MSGDINRRDSDYVQTSTDGKEPLRGRSQQDCGYRGDGHGRCSDGPRSRFCARRRNGNRDEGERSRHERRHRRCRDRAGDSRRAGRPAGGNHNHPEGDCTNSPLHLGRTFKKHVRAIIALACFFVLFSSASAYAVPGGQTSIQFDMEALSKELEVKPNLEGFAAKGAAFDGEAERAIASLINLEKMYNGSSFLESHPYSAVTEVNGAQLQIETFTEADEHAFQALSSGGTTETAIAAETADAAESAGLFTSAAGGVFLALVPLAGTLVYQDITTGTNFITQAITSSTEDLSKIEEQGGVSVEGFQWIRYPPLNNTVPISRSIQLRYKEVFCGGPEIGCGESTHQEQEVDHLKTHEIPCSCTENEESHGSGVPDYYLQIKVGGWWYTGAPGVTFPGVTPGELSETWSFANSYTRPLYKEWTEPIAGYPTNLRHVATQTVHGTGNEQCWPDKEGYGPGHECGNVWPTVGVRAPSRMHMHLPKHMTKAEVEKLESEGHRFNHYTGTVPNSTTEPAVIKKLAAKLKEHGQRRQEQFECHYMECELEGTEPQPETRLSPPLPGKAPEIPPPIPGTTVVPSCTIVEQSGGACVTTLKEAGFTKTKIEELGWEQAVVTKPPLTTIRTNPSEGAEVETSTEVNVIENPSTEHFPVAVPSINYGHETGTQYKERLETEGWTKVQVKQLTETSTDPHIGPDQASYTQPATGTETAPGRATDITVEANPSTAPVPETGGGIGGPTLPGFKMPHFGVLCKGFPFGVPCWLIHTIESWSGTAEAPEWGIDEFSIKGYKIPGYKFHLSRLEPIMEKVRPAMLIFVTIGLVLLFYNFAKGGSPPSGGGNDNTPGSVGGAQPDEGVYL